MIFENIFLQGISINMNIHSLLSIFEDLKAVRSVLYCMDEIGMGYVSLGQMSMTLSGGEAQRIKLAKYLGLSSKGNSLYILDEPTSGLNAEDVDRLPQGCLPNSSGCKGMKAELSIFEPQLPHLV